jgi:uncharacterized damage-inducible protein DinB
LIPAVTAGRLRSQLDCLAILLRNLEDGALDRRPVSGKWSARENLAHLARYHEVFLERLGRILAEDRPNLGRYSAEDDAEWPRWSNLPASEILSRLTALRERLVQRVESLSAVEISRSGIHSRFGEMNLVEWLEFFLLHEAHHLMVVLQRSRQTP